MAHHLSRPPFLPEDVKDGMWSFDPDQPPIVVYTPALGNKHLYNFHFAGWHFNDWFPNADPVTGRRGGSLLLWAVLHNPEGNAYLSYHSYCEAPLWYDPEEYEKIAGRKFAAAWLIAHWYEHYMHTCPCQVDDAKPTNFRNACIQTLLDLNP